MFEYNAVLDRVVDGDTLDAIIDLGFDTWKKTRVRFYGINAPESRTRDKVEKKFGLASKARLKKMLPTGSIQHLKTQIDRSGEDKRGKFGRVLGDFLVDGKPATAILIEEGYAVAYHGQNKDEVEKAHLNNRERLLKEGKVTL